MSLLVGDESQNNQPVKYKKVQSWMIIAFTIVVVVLVVITSVMLAKAFLKPSEKCSLGYFGDPLATESSSDSPKCQPCKCSTHGGLFYDKTSIPRCSTDTGECVCKSHVEGYLCNICKDGYFNIESGNGCEPCPCNPLGSHGETCVPKTGVCNCKPHVIGERCDLCEDGYFNIESNDGCNEPCNCDSKGSHNSKCHPKSGNCNCKFRVKGQHCEVCEDGYYNIESGNGCEPCYCHPLESRSRTCHQKTGACNCRLYVIGQRCDMCKAGYFKTDLGWTYYPKSNQKPKSISCKFNFTGLF